MVAAHHATVVRTACQGHTITGQGPKFRQAVTYLGRVEQADKEVLHARPLRPCTQALIASVPALSPMGWAGRRAQQATRVGEDVPGALAIPAG